MSNKRINPDDGTIEWNIEGFDIDFCKTLLNVPLQIINYIVVSKKVFLEGENRKAPNNETLFAFDMSEWCIDILWLKRKAMNNIKKYCPKINIAVNILPSHLVTHIMDCILIFV